MFSLATKEIRLNYDEIIMAILSVRPTQLIALARHDLNKNQQNLTSSDNRLNKISICLSSVTSFARKSLKLEVQMQTTHVSV